MAEELIKSKFDFTGIDTRNIDPDRLDMGTKQQDCALIASTFERGAHATPTEAAVFATLTRNLQNNKHITAAISENLNTYLAAPQDSASQAARQAADLASGTVDAQGNVEGAAAQTDHIMQSINVGDQDQSTYGQSFGDKLLDMARECIPCDVRLMSFLEMQPNIDLLGIFEDYLATQLSMLADVASLLTNFDIYGDFCELLNLLSFMCIPDLQRIIALLMALFMLQVPELDGMINLLQSLIAPIFAPILMSIAGLMDQFTQLVVSPLDCVVDAINAQLEKLSIETDRLNVEIHLNKQNPLTEISNGLVELNKHVQEGIQQVNNKMNFYVDQIKAMLGELGGTDTAYLQSKLKILQLTRTISFVSAIIAALSRGHDACSSTGEPVEMSEIDNFFHQYLNPQSPFNLWLDDQGEIHIDEKVPEFEKVAQPPNQNEPLPELGNVFQFEGKPLLDPTVATTVDEVSAALAAPIQAVIPCKLETSVEDAQQVNQWVEELNKA